MTLQDLINSFTTDTSAVTADQAAIVAAQAKQTTDTAQEATDSGALASALAQTGPVAEVNADGSVTVFSPATAAPGFTSQKFPAAGSVPVPAAPPAPGA
jgi:uncharacterized surface protein with fasciclin (FAS1) repeats